MLTCSRLRGSLRVTGMDTLDKSFPMFLYRKFHTEKSSVRGFGAGRRVRRPVKHFPSSSISAAGEQSCVSLIGVTQTPDINQGRSECFRLLMYVSKVILFMMKTNEGKISSIHHKFQTCLTM